MPLIRFPRLSFATTAATAAAITAASGNTALHSCQEALEINRLSQTGNFSTVACLFVIKTSTLTRLLSLSHFLPLFLSILRAAVLPGRLAAEHKQTLSRFSNKTFVYVLSARACACVTSATGVSKADYSVLDGGKVSFSCA